MTTRRAVQCIAGIAVALPLLVAPADAASGTYRGRTSQREAISFTVAHGRIRALQFRIEVTCQNGHVWSLHDYGFPPIRIVRSHFDRRFRAGGTTSAVRNATVEVRGRTFRRRVTGTLIEKASLSGEGSCQGRATFSLHH